MINLKPTGNNIIVKDPVISSTTESGIIKPESLTKEEKQALNKLEVLAVGPDAKTVSVGDFVALSRFTTPTLIATDKGDFLIFSESSVIALY